jgi:hypothetical protein
LHFKLGDDLPNRIKLGFNEDCLHTVMRSSLPDPHQLPAIRDGPYSVSNMLNGSKISAWVMVFAFLGFGNLFATEYTFTGNTPDSGNEEFPPGTGVWNNPMHWDPDTGVPGGNDTAILNASHTLNLNGDFSVLNFSQGSGFFGGSGTLTVLQEWSPTAGAELRDSVRIIVEKDATIVDGVTLIDTVIVQLLGNTKLTGDTTITINDNAAIRNAGTVTYESGFSAITSDGLDGVFINDGTLINTGADLTI